MDVLSNNLLKKKKHTGSATCSIAQTRWEEISNFVLYITVKDKRLFIIFFWIMKSIYRFLRK